MQIMMCTRWNAFLLVCRSCFFVLLMVLEEKYLFASIFVSDPIFSIGGKRRSRWICGHCLHARPKFQKSHGIRRFTEAGNSSIGQWAMNLPHFRASHFKSRNSSSFYYLFSVRVDWWKVHGVANRNGFSAWKTIQPHKPIKNDSAFLFAFCTIVSVRICVPRI